MTRETKLGLAEVPEVADAKPGELEAEEVHRLDVGRYFRNEVVLMLERAGFADVVVHGEHEEREPTPDDDFLVFVARKA